MDDPGTVETIWRLAVAALVMIAPTLLFLGLVRGLERLRDDAFVERWLHEQGHELEDDVLTALAIGIDVEADGSSSLRCPGCGESNTSNARYCRNCLGRLPS
ncbi:zinc ribbon domain-containing protein [Natribaculum luteum]|uniref:Zinc ribbon domain-containing protein n=1 Tax=Natribaculum luteum TaxID=1586232 RepID=A0ABD5NWN2_9EURY|nr:zinc ribbon domain-containing protein [Natribaculum luteum]